MSSFKLFRLHLFCFEANAYLETVAKLVLPTEGTTGCLRYGSDMSDRLRSAGEFL